VNTGVALGLSLVLLVGNAFFVAAEFALVASRRHRLEQAAAAGSRAAEAALAGSRELSLMLAGAQLGITLCSLGLGALAEPAIAHGLDPLFTSLGLPDELSYALAFLLSLAIVVLLHMVVGEMAPKSWAITHPERSALLLALPFRAFTRVVGPALAALNGVANAVLRVVKVEPQTALAQVHGPAELRMLLAQSREHGLLPADQHRMLDRMLSLQNTTVDHVMVPRERIVTVPLVASVEEMEAASNATGRSRLAVVDGDQIVGIVHVRDVLRTAMRHESGTAQRLMKAPSSLTTGQAVLDAIQTMRADRAQLALVREGGATVGLVTMEDLLEEVIEEFEDETDRASTPRR
jgi:CBS domain containing-hemolysin-like protein